MTQEEKFPEWKGGEDRFVGPSAAAGSLTSAGAW